MHSGYKHDIHLRGDDQALDAIAFEGSDFSSLNIKAGSADITLFFHQEKNIDDEPNGFTDERIMRSIDDLLEELVKLRTKAMQRIRQRQILRDALEAEKLPRPFDSGRTLTQDECDLLGLDNRERVWQWEDLTAGQQAQVKAAGVHSLIQR